MSTKDISAEMSSIDNKIVIGLSLFVLIACFTGLFLLAGSSGMTGFSVFEIKEIGGISLGVIFFAILILIIITVLANLAFLRRN